MPVELSAYETLNSKVYLNPDGTLSADVFFSPVNYVDEHGNLEPIDLTPVPDGSGGWDVSRNNFQAHFSKIGNERCESISYQGMRVDLTPVAVGQTEWISNSNLVTSAEGTAPQAVAPQKNGTGVVYPGVFPGVTYQDVVTSVGVKEVIKLNQFVPGMHRFAFRINTSGVTPRLASDGSVQFVNAEGEVVFTLPRGVMQDSNVDPHSGDPASSNNVTYSLVNSGKDTILIVDADPSWLEDPARVYPVYIDPTFTVKSQISDAYVSSAYPTTNYSGTSGLYNSSTGDEVVKVGYYDSTTGTNWAYFKLPPASQLPLLGLTVKSATFNAYCDWSYYTSTAEPTWLWANSSSNWSTSSITWNTRPPYFSSAISSASTYRGQWASFDITKLVQDWSDQVAGGSYQYTPEQGFFLSENGNGQAYWHKFAAVENSSNQPYIHITYAAPAAPWGMLVTHHDNADGYVNLWWKPVPGAAQYDVEIWDGHQYEAFAVSPINGNGTVQEWTSKGKGIWPTASEIQQGRWQLHHDGAGTELSMDPAPVYQNAYKANGGSNYGGYHNYWFRIAAVTKDGQVTDVSDPFTPTMQPDVAEEGEGATMVPLRVGEANGATGNFVLTDTDLSTQGFGPQVTVTRTYNSDLRTAAGAFGNGWLLGYQEHIAIQSNLVHVVGPDGHESIFWPQPDGTFASPPGETSWTLTAVKNSSGAITGYTLQRDDYTTEAFQTAYTASDGTQEYLLSSIQDSNGNRLTLSYDSGGHLQTLRDASGRITTLTYNAAGLVQSIVFQSGSSTETWIYGYDGSNDLTSVTDPNGQVTRYGYSNGQLTSVTTPNGGTYTLSYDGQGRVVKVTGPDNNMESLSYGSSLVTYTDPNGIQTTWSYDVDHQTTNKVLDPAGLKYTWTYQYNEFGEVTAATDPKGNQTLTSYDEFGQLVSVQDPKKNRTQLVYGNSQFGQVDHELSSVKLPSGGAYQFQYDQSHNQTTMLTPDHQVQDAAYKQNGMVAEGAYPYTFASNLLENSSFESWSNGLPAGWSELGASHTDTQSTDALIGGNAWAVSGASGVVYLFPTSTPISLTDARLPSDWDGIGFEVYAKASSAAAAAGTRLQINYFNASGSYIGQSNGTVIPEPGGWYKLTLVVQKSEFPSGTVSFRPLIITSPQGGDTVVFDAATLVPYAMAPQYNAIVNADFSYPGDAMHDWVGIGSVSVVPADATNQNQTGTASDAGFGPFSQVVQIVPSSSAWSGLHPSDSNAFIPYKPGQTYVVSALIKGYKTSSTYVTLQCYDSTKSKVLGAVQSQPYSGTFGWQYVTATLKAGGSVPAGTAYLIPEVMVASGTGGDTWTVGMRLSIDPHTTTYGYDSSGNYLTQETDPLGAVTTYTVNDFGDETSVTDPNGHTLTMTFDADHQLLSQSSSEANLKVQYTYDGDGNVRQITETSADGSTTYASEKYAYDGLDQLTSYTDALGHVTQYQYDADGNLIQTTLPDGHAVGATYDNAGRKLSDTVDGATVHQFVYDANGNLQQMQSADRTTSYGYDANDNLTSQTDSVGSQSFSYNADDLLQALTATVGSTSITTSYTYDSQDRITGVTVGGQKAGTYRYSEQGLYDTVILGDGVTGTYRYDADLHLVELSLQKGSSVLADYRYTYDPAGNLTQVTDGTSGKVLASYQYDALRRLTQEVRADGTKVGYQYDALGNIVQRTVTAPDGSSTTTTYTYDAANELTGVNGQVYT
ncbi:MAG: DNRLRE domain-containing protein, partial [Thermoflavifilum sp.]|nr:DNRLRE domain-containing protein [Thermoflavifilum sp.]MCL6515198.1 DNRLRE domain-containing protein [Alicyclobacillus sp.]